MTEAEPSKQPEALRLADALMLGPAMIAEIDLPEAAAELRKQHDEIERHCAARFADAQFIAAQAAEIDTLKVSLEQARLGLGKLRMCLTCGATKDAALPQHDPKDGCAADPTYGHMCSFDMTPQEAWQHWSKKAHEYRAELEAERAKNARLSPAPATGDMMRDGEPPRTDHGLNSGDLLAAMGRDRSGA